jgi:hypothetical protein
MTRQQRHQEEERLLREVRERKGLRKLSALYQLSMLLQEPLK